MNLKKDLLRVSVSNIFSLLMSLINGIFLPSFLTIKGYADYRTFTLYASLIGFLHFGFVDGINVRYGGKCIENVNLNALNKYHSFFINFQLIVIFILFSFCIFLDSTIFYLLIILILPINIQSFFLFFYQAIGEFKKYSKITIIYSSINISTTLLLIFINCKTYYYFILGSIVAYLITMIILEYDFCKIKKNKTNIDKHTVTLKNIKEVYKYFIKYNSIFKSGFYIMVGTVIFNFIFDCGRWFTKLFLDSTNFALYSMSASLIGFIVIFVSAINKTFYPYIFNNNNNNTINNLKINLYIVSSSFISLFFILEKIITTFIPKYSESLSITAVLFLSIPPIFIIKSIYANKYKIERKEKEFITDSLCFLTINMIFNCISLLIFKNLLSISISSVLTLYIWSFIPNILKIQNVRTFLNPENIVQLKFILSITICFTVTYNLNLNFILKFILYAISTIIFQYLLFNKSFVKYILKLL